MNVFKKLGAKLGIKAFSDMRFPGRSFVFFDFPRLETDEMAKEIGDGTSSDIVITPIRWLQRAFREANIVVTVDGEIKEKHELPALIAKPNEFYSSDHLFAGTLFSLLTAGNAYWLKVSNDNGKVKELWWIPDQLIEPKWPDDGKTFISHYEYKVGGEEIKLDVKDVVHFRDGVDPANMRKGLSPLRGLLREIWTDNEAAVFTAALMRNGGVPGLVISPDGEHTITQDQADYMKEFVQTEVTRERRGKPIVMTGKTKVEQFGFSPQQMDLSPLRDVSEERVTAAMGVPAAVVGFGAGLQATKVGATMRELRQLAWHNGVIPLQQIVARTLQREFADTLKNGVVEFDNSEVAALADDETKHVERVTSLVKTGIWTRGEGRTATGKEATPADDVYLLPLNVLETPITGQLLPPDAEKYLKSRHTMLEEHIVSTAPQATPAQAVQGFGKIIDRIRQTLPAAMEADLLTFFASLADSAEAQALEVLTVKDSLDAARIAEGMALLGEERALRQLFERHYLRVGNEIGTEIGKFLSVEVGLPDAAARSILATGGTRAGLLDLSRKTRRKIFERLVEGRISGLAGDNLARFIRDGVAAGPWSTPAIRAKVIARTETAFATNIATVEAARGITGVEQMMILDARAGDTDELCEQMNGRVVTIDEARQLVADEHPNGTRQAVPITPQLAQEMGL